MKSFIILILNVNFTCPFAVSLIWEFKFYWLQGYVDPTMSIFFDNLHLICLFLFCLNDCITLTILLRKFCKKVMGNDLATDHVEMDMKMRNTPKIINRENKRLFC